MEWWLLSFHWNKEKKICDFELAAQYFFSTQCSYGPHFLGWPSSVYLKKEKYEKIIEKLRMFSEKVATENKASKKLIVELLKENSKLNVAEGFLVIVSISSKYILMVD